MSRTGHRVSFLLAACALVLVAADARAATNMFIKFEEPAVAGGGAAGEIEVLSFSHGFSDPASRSGAGRGPGHDPINFTKYLDPASDDLLKHCWSGKKFGKATLSAYRSDGADNKPVLYLTITMENVVVADCRVNGGAGDVPVETITLDYGTIQYQYIDRKQRDEENTAKFDRKTGKVE